MINKIQKLIKKYLTYTQRKFTESLGKIEGNLIHAYWFDDVPNFGDLLNPLLLKMYGLTPIKTDKPSAEVIAVGSVLQDLKEDYFGYIVGAGLMYDKKKIFNKAKILALRGALTRENLGCPKDVPLGDPGLLISKFFKNRCKKKYVLGIIPHFEDKHDEKMQVIQARYKNEIKIIDVQKKPKQVIMDIDQCSFVLSSSLHGIVAADSLGIPNGWLLLSDNVRGGGYKFHDYASAFGRKIKSNYISGNETLSDLLKLTQSVSENIGELKSQLDIVFRQLSKEIREIRRNL